MELCLFVRSIFIRFNLDLDAPTRVWSDQLAIESKGGVARARVRAEVGVFRRGEAIHRARISSLCGYIEGAAEMTAKLEQEYRRNNKYTHIYECIKCYVQNN